ncbi:ABC transporter substrate-binding protein [Paenibacillus contaminans]|uniref:Fe3+-hydroxamate ABC transporter substrate-binding protein n=1 Tax=Paenibacillus contaminans TaxID=450362 RepID=A0A329MQV3_9BACL|nr:ABC transporter substrate-binding protein [Paenibacillus contaminans]RAV22319.1 Fe3+-hydroxamate ABC transporter substrate-binding protein [Paenibacillus contaminans]
MKQRRTAIPVLLILIFLLMTACGKSGEGTLDASNSGKPQVSPAASTPSASPAVNAETRTYKDGLGREVVIPAKPKRIVTTQYLPDMLALGVKPIGAPTHLLTNFDSVKSLIGGIEDLGAVNELNVEKTVSLNPDLIIAMEGNQELIDKLSKIAPTVVVKWSGSDPFQHLKDVAAVLGLSDKADQWIAAYNKKSEEVRAKLAAYVKPGETFGTVVIGGYEKGQLRVYGDSNVGFTLFKSLQFPMTDTVKKEWSKGGHDLGMKISLEKLPEYASADRLFVVKFDNDPDFLKQVENSSLWNNLPAVKNNKVYVVNDSLWFSLDVMSFDQQLDDAVKLLAK